MKILDLKVNAYGVLSDISLFTTTITYDNVMKYRFSFRIYLLRKIQ